MFDTLLISIIFFLFLSLMPYAMMRCCFVILSRLIVAAIAELFALSFHVYAAAEFDIVTPFDISLMITRFAIGFAMLILPAPMPRVIYCYAITPFRCLCRLLRFRYHATYA